MQNIPIYEALAQAFAAEGVDTHFTLMGDGNMASGGCSDDFSIRKKDKSARSRDVAYWHIADRSMQ
jgi:hypothetical protein